MRMVGRAHQRGIRSALLNSSPENGHHPLSADLSAWAKGLLRRSIILGHFRLRWRRSSRGMVMSPLKRTMGRIKIGCGRLLPRQHGELERTAVTEQLLRDAIDALPQGIVFLDADGRYIMWNQQYAEFYKKSADLFSPGVKLVDTLRTGIARGDYPQAAGREEEWLAERMAQLNSPGARHEQWLSDGRCILIEERQTAQGNTIGLRVDIT